MKCVFDSKRIEMGNRIRTLRKRRVGSQSEFAEKLDVSVITISRIENGMTKIDAELLIKDVRGSAGTGEYHTWDWAAGIFCINTVWVNRY